MKRLPGHPGRLVSWFRNLLAGVRFTGLQRATLLACGSLLEPGKQSLAPFLSLSIQSPHLTLHTHTHTHAHAHTHTHTHTHTRLASGRCSTMAADHPGCFHKVARPTQLASRPRPQAGRQLLLQQGSASWSTATNHGQQPKAAG